ncbi:MAG: hypothetical protein ACI9K2_003027 [Myxococcota bacterium]
MIEVALALAALLASPALAQDGGHLEGVAFDALTGRPVPGVEVRAGDVVDHTDTDGYFRLDLPAGTWTVQLDAPSQRDGTVSDVAVVAGEWTEMLVTLSADPPRARVQAPVNGPRVVVDAAAVLAELRGVVTSADDSTPVAGARVYVRGAAGEGVTGDDGTFVLQVPVGTHPVTVLRNGFSTQTLPEVVLPEEGASIAVVLSPRGVALDDFTISAPYIEGSTASLLDERRESSSVADVLGAEEMSRSGDGDAAAALSRVTGLTVVGGKYVFVRGLGDRYSSSLLNGSSLPSPEPERRVVPLDLFPASILESVVIQKSWSPDQPAEFGGGVVQLRTKRPPRELVAEVGLSGTYLHGTTLTNGLDYAGGKTDWLGIDGGWRDLPGPVVTASESSPLEEGDMFSDRGYTGSELEKLGETMPNRWNTLTRQLPPGFGGNMALGHGTQLGEVGIGGLAAVTYSNSWQQLDFNRKFFLVGEGGALERSHDYQFDQATNDVQAGLFVTGGVDVAGQSVTYTGTMLRSTDDTARVYEGYNRDVGDTIRVTRLRWVERKLLVHQVRGEHALGRVQLDWRAMGAGAGRLEPDRREYRQDRETARLWYLSDRPEGNQRFFSDLVDDTLEVGLDGTVNLDEEGTATVKVGGVLLDRAREVDTRRFKFFHRGVEQDVLANDPEGVFTPENIGPGSLQFEEFTQPTDNYTAAQRIRAAYAMTELPLQPWLRVMGGARLESSRQQVTTFELFNPDGAKSRADLGTTDLLPAGTFTVSPRDDVNIRGGYSRTVSRPDFRELSEAPFNDVTGGRLTFGNPTLQRARIDHFDLRVEWFPSPEEVLSASVFTKTFTDPVETVVIASAQQSVTWDNAEGAVNQGVELEYRKELLPVLYTAGNIALIRSSVDIARKGTAVQTSTERALQGQSPYVINLQLGYDDHERGTGVTLLYNVAGKRIAEVGAQGAPDTYELPVHRLDMVARQALGRGFGVSVKGKNLLDSTARVVQGDKQVEAIRQGWSVGVGLSWSAPTGE